MTPIILVRLTHAPVPWAALALLTLFILNLVAPDARAATFVWTNSAGGAWSNAVNWSPNQVPSAADLAFITNSGAYTVSLTANAQASALTLGGAGGTPALQQTAGTFTLGGASRILAGGSFNWSAGTLAGALTVASNGLFIIEGTATKSLNAAVTNQGTMQLNGGDFYVNGNNGARIENLGTFDLQGDQDLYGFGTSVLRNTGLLRKTAGTGNARVGLSGSYPISFQNTGTVEAQSGVILFFGGGLLDGNFTTVGGARNEFTGGTFTHSGSGTPLVSGAGLTRLTGGTFQLHDTVPNLQFIGGAVVLLPDFQGTGAITNLTLEGSTLNGSNLVTGTLRWRDGTFGGALSVASNGLFIVEGTATKSLNAAVTNRGTMQLSGGDFYVNGNNGARIENFGTLDLQSNQDLYGFGGAVLRNTGLLRKTAGTGNTRVGVANSYAINFQNSGTIEAQSGVLLFFGGGVVDGVLNTTVASARIDFSGGTYTHSGGGAPVVSGAGLSRLTGGTFQLHDTIPNFQFVGGTVVMLPDFQGTGAITNLTLEGATLTGTNLVTGTLRWRAGTFNGALTVASNGLFILEGSADKTLNAAVTNQGTMQFSGSGSLSIYASNGGRIENAGLFDLLGDQDLYGFSGTVVLRNTGLLRKSTGSGNARVGVANSYAINFQNSGTVEAQSGVILFFGGGVVDGFLSTTVASARIDFSGGTYTHSGNGAPVVSGAGLTRLTGGTFQLHDTIPNFQFVGGTVVLLPDFQAGGAVTNLTLEGATLTGTNLVTGTLRWRAGTFNGALTVASNGLFILEGSADKTLNATVTNHGTMQFSGSGSLSIYASNGGRIENAGLFDLLGDQDLYGFNGTVVLRNTGLLRKSAGTGNARVGVANSYAINFQNSGTIEAQSGVLLFFGGGVVDGVLNTTVASARIDFSGGTYTHSGGGAPVVSGAGLSRLTGGTFQLHDTIPNFQFVGGTVVMLPDFQGTGAITNLTLEGATLTGTNLVTGTLRWWAGTFNGALTVASNGLFILEGSADKTLNAAVTNQGTMQFSGSGSLSIYASNGGRIENAGLFDLLGDQDLYGFSGTVVLRNTGLLRKSTGSGNARVGVANSYAINFQNSGTVEAQSGVILFFGGGVVDGFLSTTVASARIDFSGGTYTHSGNGAPVVSGAGLTRLTGGTFQLHDTIPNFQFVGGTVVLLPDFQAGGAVTNLTLEGATLTGTNLVTGTLRWRAGTFNGALTVASNGLFILEGSADKTLNATVTNHGTMQFSGSGSLSIYASNGGRIENAGLFDLLGDQDLYGFNGTVVLRNTGLLRKSAGTGNARVGVANSYAINFQNSGTIEAQSGVLLFFGGGVVDGVLNTTVASARLDFSGGTYTHSGGGAPVVSGAGLSRLTGGTFQLHDTIPNFQFVGGTVVLLPDFQAGGAITNLTLEGSTLTGTNLVTGTLRWRAGTFNGALTVASNAWLFIESAAVKTLNATVTNRGTIELSDGGELYVYGSNGARIENDGLFELQGDERVYGLNGTPAFRNRSVLRKTAGTGIGYIGVTSSYPVSFENTGTVESQSGTVLFFGNFSLAGGVLRSSIRSLTDYGRFTFAGNVSLDGILSAYLVGGYSPAVSNKFNLVAFNSASGAFSGLDLPEGFAWRADYAVSAASITALGACTQPPSGMVAWWPGDGNANDVVGANHGTLQNGATTAAGLVGQAFSFNGSTHVEVPDSPQWAFGANGFSLALWASFSNASSRRTFIASDDGVGTQEKWIFWLDNGQLIFHLNGSSGIGNIGALPFTPATNQWYHLAVTRNGSLYSFFTNGVLATTATDPRSVPDASLPLTIGRAEGGNYFAGLLDEITIYSRALSSNEVTAIYASGAAGLCRPTQPPFFVTHPKSRTNGPGSLATFSVVAAGSSPIFYQWLQGASPLASNGHFSGAQSSVLTITNVQPADAGTYSCVISNLAGTTNSLGAQLVVDASPPVISQLATNPGIVDCDISWQTSEPATAEVQYGLTAAYGSTNRYNGALRTQHGLTLTGLTPGTQYHFRVRSADAVSNETYSADFTFTTLPAPDLRVASVAIPIPSVIRSGLEITIRWVLTNSGLATVNTPFYDRVQVVNSNTTETLLNTTYYYNPGAVGSTSIAPGGTLTRETRYRLPDGPRGAGTITATVTADSQNSIIEYNGGGTGEANNANLIAFSSTLPAYSDLQIANLQLLPPSPLSGTPLQVLWQSTNSGSGTATGQWWDRVLIVNTSRSITLFNGTVAFDTGTLGPLTNGTARDRSLSFALPDSTNAVGDLLITVTADHYNSIFEYVPGRDAETNNVRTASTTVALATYPDLRVAGLQVIPVSPVSGDLLTVSWLVTNAGNAAVNGSFNDRALLRQPGQSSLASQTLFYDATLPANGAIAPGETRARQVTLQLPDGTNGVGNLQVELTTDVNNQVLEIVFGANAEANNTATNSFTSTLAAYSDLVAGAIVNPPAALPGETITLRWNVTNIGVGPLTDSWSEQIFWSDDAALGSDDLLATFAYTNTIAPGAFVSRTQQVVVPTLESGNRWFIIRVDSAARIFELNESNNVALGGSPMNVPAGTTLLLGGATIGEGAVRNATLSRNGDTGSSATFTLLTLATNRLAVPATVNIPAGQASTGFQITSLDNNQVDGNLLVGVTATAAGYAPASNNVTVVDNDQATLYLQSSKSSLTEGAGTNAALCYITRNTPTNTALVVPLATSESSRVFIPDQVTIPAGASSAVFDISIGNNIGANVTAHITISGSVPGYQSFPAQFNLLDDDTPALVLALSDPLLIENAPNPAGTLTITRSPVTAGRTRLALSSTNSGAASVPNLAIIETNQASVTVPITVFNNAFSDGPRAVELRVYPTDDLIGTPLLTNGAAIQFIVSDDDGPALAVQIAAGVISETGATTGTVRRNTTTSSNLVVNLASSLPGEATVPATVTISNGQTSATFPITGVTDGQPDGNRSVSFTATAAGFNPGGASLNVSDIDLPDLRPVAVISTNAALTDSLVPLSFVVNNTGLALAEGVWVDRVYLANSLAGDGLRLVGQSTHFTEVPLGGSYTSTAVAFMPGQAGNYYVLVVVDEKAELNDGNRANNRFFSTNTIAVNPAYRATITADLASTVAGTPIPLHGRAFRPSDNASVPNARVTIRTNVKGVRRTFETFSDASGNINYVLRLLPSEAGLVLLSADHPGVAEDTTQDSVEVYGMRFAEYEVTPRIFPFITHTGVVEVVNLGDLPLTGVSAVFEGLPDFVIPEISVANKLLASERIPLTYRLTATNVVSATLVARIKITSAQGAVATVQTRINLQPLMTTLVSTPGLVQAGAVRGDQKAVEFMVANVGGIPSGELTVIPPDLPWVALSSPSNLPSLGPGDSTRITLLLTPAADAALTLFNAPLYVVGENARLEVPTRLRIMSSAVGDLSVEVQDDYTYYVDGAPRVTNATVRLTDPYTHEVVAEGLTYPGGSIVFSNLLEGPYQMRVTADKHSTFAGPVLIAAGVESSRVVFLSRQTVSYRWTVVPTEVEDRYQIVLEPVFETAVPIPVVTLDTPRIPLIIKAGGEGYFDIRLSNHGLIAAERVTVTVPDDPDYELTPLAEVVDVLPAQSTITIPIRVRAKTTLPRLAYNGPRGGHMVRMDGELPTCGKTITGCDSLPKMSVKWSWICGQNRQWMGVHADLEFSCAPDDCWEKIEDQLKGLGESILKGDVADLKDLKDFGKDNACELIAMLAACLGITDQCVLATLQAACGIATKDLGTAAAGGAGMGANCICPNFDLPTYKPSEQKDFGAFDGEAYYSGPASFGKPEEQPTGGPSSGDDCEPGLHPMRPAKRGDVAAASESVCARVRLRLEQEVVLARQAFLGSLEVDNGNLTSLTDVQVILDIRDTAGNSVNHRFAVGGPELKGLSAVDGTGVIAAQSPGSAQYTFIPTREAAPDGPVVYKFGGTLVYHSDGQRIEVPLAPEPITVYPDPVLHLDYFLQRDVYADDPFTPEREPSEPFALGLLVRNLGKGPARNMRITSAQPKIIENEKGLLIDFKLIGTIAGTNSLTPSLTVKLGDIDAGKSQVAGFFMTASLQGKFVEYNATFEHLDTLGDQTTSLIDSLTLHEMTRVVRDDRAGADALMDFLANDVPDSGHFPDTLWFSNGSQSPVNPATSPSLLGSVTTNNLSVQLNATMPAGWAYLEIADPGRFFRLHRVVRSDGKEMLVGTNVWTTDRSFPSTQAGAIRENLFHLLDHNSTGSYTLYYRIFDATAPQIVSVGAGLTTIQTTAVTNVDVVTSESLEFANFTTNDLVLLRNGAALSTASLTITNVGTNVYRIGGLAPLTGADGNYQLTVLGAGLNDFGGNPVGNNGVLPWAKGVGAPVVAFITAPAPDPRNVAVSNLDITFTQPIDPATFSLDDLQLTRDGGTNILDSTPTLTPLNATTFRLGGLPALTQADGAYALTVFGGGVSSTNGTVGLGSLTRPWTMLTTGPTITELETVNPNPRNIVVQALEVTFARPIDPASFDWHDLTLTRDGSPNLISSDVQVTPISNTVYRLSNFNWVQSTAGNYTLTIFGSGILDPAGNAGAGAASQSWSLVLGHPPEPRQLAISPDTGALTNDGITASNTVNLTGTLTIANLAVRVYDDTVGADLGTATVVGTNFSKLLTLASAGSHALRIYSVDGAQNVSSNVLFNVFLDVTPPGGALVAVTPNPRTNAVPTVDAQFTEAVNSNSVTRSAFTLRRNGGADLLTPAVTVTRLNPSSFRLNNLAPLNGTPGDYILTMNLASIEDLAGNHGGGTVTQAWTVQVAGPNNPPVLQTITNRTAPEGVLIRFTALASDPDQPGQTLNFSLGAGAPAGAGIDAASGAFTWRPNSLQGPAAYPISVIVRDNGAPSLGATQTFLVNVTDALPDVVVTVDNATVLTAQTSSVPIRLDSGVVITNLTFDLQTVPSRLGQLALQSPSVDVLGSTWQPLGGDRYRASLVLNPIPGGATNRTLVRLGFVADSNSQSGFVDVNATNVVALRTNGTPVANTAGRTGRISLVGIQPLLQISGIVNRSVLLHGRIGVNYVIEGTDEIGPGAEWLPVTSVVLSNVVQLVPLPPGPPQVFYRALEAVETGGVLPLSAAGGFVQLRLTGVPGQIYLLERRSDVNSPWLLQRPILISASIQTNQVPGLNTNELWRLRLWYAFPPQLSVSSGSNGTLPVTVFGRPGIPYRLEHSSNLASNNWQVISNAFFTVPGRVLTLPAPGSAGFYRALEQ